MVQFILVESTDESNKMFIQFQPVCERPNQSPDCKAEQVLILLYLLYGLWTLENTNNRLIWSSILGTIRYLLLKRPDQGHLHPKT